MIRVPTAGGFTLRNTGAKKPLVEGYNNLCQFEQKAISEEISKVVSIVSVIKVLIWIIHCLPVHRLPHSKSIIWDLPDQMDFRQHVTLWDAAHYKLAPSVRQLTAMAQMFKSQGKTHLLA